MHVTVPANTTAMILVPASCAGVVLESGVPAATAPGLKALGYEAGSMRLQAGSGQYHFTSKLE
jgi:alpha-L-rhamnosidase